MTKVFRVLIGYTEKMRRILQFSTFILILTMLLAPISEAFDHWDPPGLGHDTEFAVLAFVFCIALVLAVSNLVAMLRQIILLLRLPGALVPDEEALPSITPFRISYLAADLSPPLRI